MRGDIVMKRIIATALIVVAVSFFAFIPNVSLADFTREYVTRASS